MGDFLDNLAAKSLNRGPLLEPRPVSRFEPWQPGGALGAASARVDASPGGERETDRVETARPWPARENDAAPPTRLDQLQREAPLVPTLQSFPPRQPESPAVTLHTVLPPASRNGESHAEALPAAVRDPSDAVADERTSRVPASAAPVTERTERVIIERERATQEHEAVPTVVRPAVSSAPAFLAPAPATRVEPQAIIEKMPPQHLASAQNVARPLVTPIIERIERAQDDSDRGGVSRWGTAPTIHVTIGRIEVRATPPPAPVRRASSPAATMSLEEYLRSRSGDKR